jgi:hypothetical protein
MRTFELMPVDGRKSFNGKARVIEEKGVSKLLSYDTVVAEYSDLSGKMTVHGYFSPTTARHINAFLNYYGFDQCTKKELENYNK